MTNLESYQFLLGVIVVLALFIAIVAYIRTPESKRWTQKRTTKQPGVSYAPMYTNKEQFQLVVKNIIWAVPLLLLLQFWIFPNLREYSSNANCYNYGSVNGMHLVYYGMLSGLPLASAIWVFLAEGISAIRELRIGQHPLPNKKTFTLTPYKYGNSVKLRALLLFSILGFIISLSIWGGFQAHELTTEIKPCADNNELEEIALFAFP